MFIRRRRVRARKHKTQQKTRNKNKKTSKNKENTTWKQTELPKILLSGIYIYPNPRSSKFSEQNETILEIQDILAIKPRT